MLHGKPAADPRHAHSRLPRDAVGLGLEVADNALGRLAALDALLWFVLVTRHRQGANTPEKRNLIWVC
jgi:hypothetical protein